MKILPKLLGAITLAGIVYVFLFRVDDMDQTTLSYVVFAFGLLCAWTGWYTTSKGKASMKWPATGGLIRKSGVKVSRGASSGDSPSRRNYTFEVEYEYEVDGKVFTNNVYSYKINYNAAQRDGPNDLVARYPEGAVVDIYYDPRKPKHSVILPGLNTWSYIPYLAAVVLLTFSVLMYLDQ